MPAVILRVLAVVRGPVSVALVAAAFLSSPSFAALQTSVAHEKAVRMMEQNPARAGQLLSHPKNDLERLDYALYLYAFRPRTRARDRKIAELLAVLKADIAKAKQWGLDLVGPMGAYDGTDKSLIPYIRAASLSGVAVSDSDPYLIPCAILARRPGLIEATEPLFGSSGDNFLPRSGCRWGRGTVSGFPKKAVAAYKRDTDIADGFGRVSPLGTIWYGIWAAQSAVLTRLMLDPRHFLKGPAPELDYPYQNWAYLSLDNHLVVQDMRRKYRRALAQLSSFYRHKGLKSGEAKRAARNALFALPLGANCGIARPGISLRTLIMDGAPVARVTAFIRSGKWKDSGRLASIEVCAESGGIDPIASVAVVNAPELRLVQTLAARVAPDARKGLDLLAGADAVNSFGKTPLMTAAQFNSVPAAKLLLAEGADVNAHTQKDSLYYDERTALHYAAASGSLDMIRLLLAHGADRNARDRIGRYYTYQVISRSDHGLRPIDYLEGKGPVAPNSRLSPAARKQAEALLGP